jgi:hypothetical protein
MNWFDGPLRLTQPMTINGVLKRHPTMVSIEGELHGQEYGRGDAQTGALKPVPNHPNKIVSKTHSGSRSEPGRTADATQRVQVRRLQVSAGVLHATHAAQTGLIAIHVTVL